MPPRGVYKAKQEEKKKQNRSPRPAQETRSDRREQERQEKANAQRALKESIARQKAKSNTKLTSPSPRRDPADIQGKIQTVVSKASGPKTTRKVVEANQPVKMSPPLPKPKSPTKFTIRGGEIKGGTIYKDPITGSTLASKETRIKAITDPKSVKVVGSRNRQTLLQATPDMSQTQLFNTQQKITSNNVDVVNRLDNPQQTKLDLVTGEKITPTLLTELSRKRKRRQKSGFTGIMSQIRSLLG
tara:strand:+ start:760 stop:1488 length:729 start_codon:yes stop_codon:yes gene_type:complete